MRYIDITEDKRIYNLPLKNLFFQGESNVNTIVFRIPYIIYDNTDIRNFSFRIDAVNITNDQRIAPYILEKTVGDSFVNLKWTVTKEFTKNPGVVTFEIVGSNASGTDVIRYVGDDLYIRPNAKGYAQTTDVEEDLLNQITGQLSEYVEAAKKQADRSAEQAVNADNSAKAAASSAANAKNSEVNAKKSETSAADSEVNIDTGLKSKLPIAEANQLIKSVEIDSKTGIFTFTRYDDTMLVIDTGLEKVVLNMRIDSDTLELILALADGTEQRVSLIPFLNLYTGGDTTTINVKVNGTIVQASVKGNSIGLNLLTPELQETINNKVTANQPGNAGQIRFSDNMSMQQKLDAGLLNGKDGVTVAIDGFFHMYVDDDGNLFVEVSDAGEQPPISLDEDGNLYWEIK